MQDSKTDSLPRLRDLTARSLVKLTTIDCHAGGEPARVIIDGLPEVPGNTMLEKRKSFLENESLDQLSQLLLGEPRGYPCQNIDYIFPSKHPSAEFGYVIAEQNRIYPAFSGHNTICVATALLETGMIAMTEPVTDFSLEAPCGIIKIRASCRDGKATNIEIENLPSFVCHTDVKVKVPELGEVTVDIAYGGMFYAIVDADALGVPITPSKGKLLCRYGEMIKTATAEQYPVRHPTLDYAGVDIVVMRGKSQRGTGRPANAVVMSCGQLDWNDQDTWTGMIDRSPCGSGTCAVMAALWAKSQLKVGEEFQHESILGTVFVGRLLREAELKAEDGKIVSAVVPSIAGQGWVTQYSTVLLDPTDPFPKGFTVGDIWAS